MHSDIEIQTEGLSKIWGGIRALDDVSLTFYNKEIHGIVGPNGAGKSTLLNILSGTLSPSNGYVFHRGSKLDRAKPWEFARKGIGRSFQKTNIFPDLTCIENCCIASQFKHGGCYDIISPKHSNSLVKDDALRALRQVNLASRENSVANELSHGEQRQLEIAMVLATSPKILLLDEPLAGMGVEESKEISDLLGKLRSEFCIVLVEHDMDVIFELSDRISVLNNGTHLFTGSVEEVRNNSEVKKAYLGE